MTEQLRLALIAIALGMVAGVVLLVPFVAISYRRRGTLTAGRVVAWSAALVYFWAIWTYTLLPLPDPDALVCAGRNLHLGTFVTDLAGAVESAEGSTRALLTDPVVLQLVLNVALFVPLGFFIRWLGGRGVVVAGLVGLAVSGFVELTQLTGVWGLYPCAYRVFDVDDLVMNTAGALLGSLLGLIVPRELRGSPRSPDAGLPRPVTKPRRLLAMALDLVGVTVVGFAAGGAVNAWLLYVVDDREDALGGAAASWAGTLAALLVWLAVVLATGRTVGDLAVRLEYDGGTARTRLGHLLRFLGGIGGYLLLDLLPSPGSVVRDAFAVGLVVTVLATRGGRGLPGLLMGAEPADDRGAAPPARLDSAR